jgi:hypothetical protein
MFRNRKVLFVEELINRQYMLNNGYDVDENGVYVKDNGLSVVNITITPIQTDHFYKVYCTIRLVSSDSLTIKFRVYDNNSAPIYKVLDDVEDKIKVYEAIVKFVES